MPQIFKVGSYWIFFWSNENEPLEPVHVHIAEGRSVPNATKIWITKDGKCCLCHNNSKIPQRILNSIMRLIESRSFEIISEWKERFKQLSFYC